MPGLFSLYSLILQTAVQISPYSTDQSSEHQYGEGSTVVVILSLLEGSPPATLFSRLHRLDLLQTVLTLAAVCSLARKGLNGFRCRLRTFRRMILLKWIGVLGDFASTFGREIGFVLWE